MMQSMTGFGKSNRVFPSRKASIEIRTLNSKGLDLSVKYLPFIRRLSHK